MWRGLLAGALLSAAVPPLPPPVAAAARLHRAGLDALHSGKPTALRDALGLFQQATRLDPGNAGYWGDYGGTCLRVADHERSYFMAVRGRDALEKTVQLNPADVDAREALMQLYGIAPWPLGDEGRAQEEAAAIGRQNPSLGAREECRLGKIFENKHKPGLARTAYAAALRFDPRNAAAAAALKRLNAAKR